MDQDYQRKSDSLGNARPTSRRRFFRQTGAGIAACIFLTSCDDLLDKILPEKPKEGEEEEPDKETGPKLDPTLAFIGDSYTIGAGANEPYGNKVGAAFSGRPVVSIGIGGQVALSISIRQGGTPLKMSVEGGKFDGLNPVRVTRLTNEFLSTNINRNTYTAEGTLAGVKCTVKREAIEEVGEVYTVTPEAESTAEVPDDSEFVISEAVKLRTATQILWYGRNNIGKGNAEQDILDAVESSVAYLSDPKRYLVLGVLLAKHENTGTEYHNQVIGINEKLAARYGKNYVAMTPPTDEEMSVMGYVPNNEDRSYIESGNFPRGMRASDDSDEIHLNDAGYQLVANRVIAKLKELEY